MLYEDYCIYVFFVLGMLNGLMILLGMGLLVFCVFCFVKVFLICIYFDCWFMYDELCIYNVMFIFEVC